MPVILANALDNHTTVSLPVPYRLPRLPENSVENLLNSSSQNASPINRAYNIEKINEYLAKVPSRPSPTHNIRPATVPSRVFQVQNSDAVQDEYV